MTSYVLAGMSSLRQRVASSLSLPPSRRRTNSGQPPDPASLQSQADGDGGGTNSSGEFEDVDCSLTEGEMPAGKPWMKVDKKVYEEQLDKLQEQLVNAMIENQSLQG